MVVMSIYEKQYNEFLSSGNSLRVYEGDTCLFVSDKPMLTPLFDYVAGTSCGHEHVVIFDKVIGNAAALLAVTAKCSEMYSPVGSEPALKTLERYGISYHISKTVPYILKPGTSDLCPMERLSIGKTPEEFYNIMISMKS